MNIAVTGWTRDANAALSVCYAIDLDSISQGRANIERAAVSDEDMSRAQLAPEPKAAVERLSKTAVTRAINLLVERRKQPMNRARRRQDAREARRTEAVV